MGQLWFFVKTLLMSLLVVIILQIHIAGQTLEQRIVGIATHNWVLSPIQGVADASVITFHRFWDDVTNRLKAHKINVGSRESKFHIERHTDASKGN